MLALPVKTGILNLKMGGGINKQGVGTAGGNHKMGGHFEMLWGDFFPKILK